VNIPTIGNKQMVMGWAFFLSLILFISVLITFFLEENLVYSYSPTCVFKSQFNFECMGCGMTRSFLSIANGKFEEAINLNKLGIPLFILSTISFPVLVGKYIIGHFFTSPPKA
jgi:hypothetical protein